MAEYEAALKRDPSLDKELAEEEAEEDVCMSRTQVCLLKPVKQGHSESISVRAHRWKGLPLRIGRVIRLTEAAGKNVRILFSAYTLIHDGLITDLGTRIWC